MNIDNRERYDDIRESKKIEEKKKFLEFESNLRIKEQRLYCLTEEKMMLLKEVSDLTKKSVEIRDHVSEDSIDVSIIGINIFKYKSSWYY